MRVVEVIEKLTAHKLGKENSCELSFSEIAESLGLEQKDVDSLEVCRYVIIELVTVNEAIRGYFEYLKQH